MPVIRPSRGTHVIVPSERLPVTVGAIVPAPDGRTIFVLPWLGQTLIGTTDNDYEGDIDHVRPADERRRLPARGDQRVLRHRAVRERRRGRLRGRAAADLHRRPEEVGRHLAQGRALRDLERDGHDHRRQAHDLAADGEDDRRPARRARRPRRALPHRRDPARHAGRRRRDLPRVEGVAEDAYEQLAGRYGYAAHEVLRDRRRARRARPADPARDARPARRGGLLGPPRAGAQRRRRAAAPHAPRADRRARAARPRGAGAGARGAGARRRAGLGRAAHRAGGRALPRATPPRRACWSAPELPSGPRRNFPPFRRLHRADRSRLRSLHEPPSQPHRPPRPAGARRAARRRPGRAGSRPARRSTARRPTSRSSAASTSPATAPAASSTSSGSTARRTCSSRASTAASSARRSASTTASARARPTSAIAAADVDRLAIVWTAGNRVYGSLVTGNDQQPGPAARPDRAPRRPRGRRHRPRDRHGHQRHRLRHVGGAGRRRLRRPRRAADGHHVDARWPRRWTSTPAAPAGRGTQRPRVGVSAEGNAVVAWGEDHADGRARVYARRVTGLDPVRRSRRSSRCPTSAAWPAGGPTRPTSTSRTTARSRGPCSARTSAGSRVDRAAAARLDVRPGRAARRRAGLDEPADRHQRPRPGPGDARGRRRGARQLQLQRHLRARRSRCTSRRRRAPAPLPASSEHREVIAGVAASGGEIKGRLKPEPTKPFENEVTLSRPDLGPVTAGNFAVARRPARGLRGRDGPGRAGHEPLAHRRASTTACRAARARSPRSAWQSGRRAKLEWRPGRDLWGPQRFRVVVGGRVDRRDDRHLARGRRTPPAAPGGRSPTR